MKKLKPLKINGYKNILSGKLLEKHSLKLQNTTIYFCVYEYNQEKYYLYDTGLQTIGYTQDEKRVIDLNKRAWALTYDLFLAFSGRK